jgi:hypothetical protein
MKVESSLSQALRPLIEVRRRFFDLKQEEREKIVYRRELVVPQRRPDENLQFIELLPAPRDCVAPRTEAKPMPVIEVVPIPIPMVLGLCSFDHEYSAGRSFKGHRTRSCLHRPDSFATV